jgi:hypothetical protein
MQIGEIQIYTEMDGTGTPIFGPENPAIATAWNASCPQGMEANKGIDGMIDSNYQNFGKNNSGFVVVPTAPTVIESFVLTTGSNEVARDPASWTLHGQSADGTWSLIGQGTLSLPAGRGVTGEPVAIENAPPCVAYRMTFPTVKDPFSANSMEVAEAQFYGTILQIGEPPAISTPSPLPAGIVSSAYSQDLTASGGAAPYTWTRDAGNLPSGLILGTDGTITGTPSAAGTTTFTLRVTGANGAFAAKEFALTVLSPAVLPDGCVAWWRGENNFLDSAGTNHGTGNNGVTFATGEVAQGWSFDGTDDYVQVPSAANLNLVSGQGWTMEGWIKPNSLNDKIIVHKGASFNGTTIPYWAFYIRNDSPAGQLAFEMCPGTGNDQYDYVKSAVPVVIGAWQHVAVVVDSMGGATSGYHIYINGVSAGNTVSTNWATSGTVNTPEPLCIGSTRGQSGFFDGLIDELAIYDRALSANEIAAIHAVGSAGKQALVPPIITTASPLPAGTVGVSYNQTMAVTGGVTPYAWLITSGALPSGLNCNNGVISGTPDTAGTTPFTVQVTGADGASSTKDFSLTINGDVTGPVVSNLRYNSLPVAEGATLTHSGIFTVDANDQGVVSQVQFFIRPVAGGFDQFLGSDADGAQGYEAYWDAERTEADGAYLLTIKASDSLGNITTETRALNLALAPPVTPTITAPTHGGSVGQVNVVVAGKGVPGGQVAIYLGGALQTPNAVASSDGSYSKTVTLSDGTNQLQAANVNRAGEGPRASVTVTLDRSVPSAPVALQAAGQDDGSIRNLSPDFLTASNRQRSAQRPHPVQSASRMTASCPL